MVKLEYFRYLWGSETKKKLFMTLQEQVDLLLALNKRLTEENEHLRKLVPVATDKRGKTSEYRGVSFDKNHNVWRAQIRIAGKVRPLGTFPPTPEGERLAAEKYQDAFKRKKELTEYYRKLDEKKAEKRRKKWNATISSPEDGKIKKASELLG